MDLSPKAQERLARLSALSEVEQRHYQRERELESVLAPFFTGMATAEDLWQSVKTLSETSGPEVVRGAQEKVLDTVKLQTNDDDLERRKAALLALETLKPSGKYSALELLLGSIISLRQRYNDAKQQALEQVREQMQAQMYAAAEQARRQGVLMDPAATLEANLQASPEWREFVSRHDASAQKTLNEYIARIRAML